MNTLIITAHPSPHGFTHRIAHTFSEARKISKGEVEIINLYDKKHHLEYLSFQDVKTDFPIDEQIQDFQQKVSQADELVFIFPMWNMSEPAILKNFFDRVFTAGFAFRYKKEGMAEGLLKGKKAHFFVTCDGPKWLYFLIGNPLKKLWKLGRMMLTGVKMKNFIYFDQMRKRSDAEKKKILEKVQRIASV